MWWRKKDRCKYKYDKRIWWIWKKNNSKINENELDNYNDNIDLKSIDKLDKNKKEQKNAFKNKNYKRKRNYNSMLEENDDKINKAPIKYPKKYKKIIKLWFYLFYYIDKD